MSKMDEVLVEHLNKPAINRCLYGFLFACLEFNKYKANRVLHYLFVSKGSEDT